MRGLAVALTFSLFVLPGCLQAAPEEVEAAAMPIDIAPPLLSQTPRFVQVPEGDSSAVLRFETTPADWSESDGMHWLFVVHESDEDAEADAMSLNWMRVHDGALEGMGSALAIGGAGSGGTGKGTTDAPENETFLAFLAVSGAAAPFEMRFGVVEDFGEDLEGESIPAEVLRSETVAHFGAFFEFGTPFDAVFPSGASTIGFEVDDQRVRAPPGSSMVTVGGSLEIGFTHDVGEKAMHFVSAYVSSFQGTRVGTWDFESVIDGESFTQSGAYAEPVASLWIEGLQLPEQSATGTFRFAPVAEVFPITVGHATTFAFDPGAYGLTAEAFYFEFGTPLVVATEEGCIDLATPAPPAHEACYVLV